MSENSLYNVVKQNLLPSKKKTEELFAEEYERNEKALYNYGYEAACPGCLAMLHRLLLKKSHNTFAIYTINVHSLHEFISNATTIPIHISSPSLLRF